MNTLGTLYRGLTALVEPAAGPLLAVWARGDGPGLRRERLGRENLAPVDTWWHAASLGEVAALEPVLTRALQRNLPGRFVVTCTSASGRARANRMWPGRASLAPLDTPGIVRRVLEKRSPGALILVETELWPNWLDQAHRRKTAVAIVNGRISDRSWPRYRRWASLFRPLVSRVRAISVQTQKDAERFLEAGAEASAVQVSGNTKHDRLPVEKPAELPWSDAVVWTLGSLRPGEEGPLLDAFGELRIRFPRLRVVLVPRHPHLWAELEDRWADRGFSWARKSRPREADRNADVLVVDGQGDLGRYYAAASVAFVGGSLVPVGGHNVLEAAGCGIPVMTGPHLAAVAEEAEVLEKAGGLVRVENTKKIVQVLGGWLEDPEARDRAGEASVRGAKSLGGGAERTLDWLMKRGVLTSGTTSG